MQATASKTKAKTQSKPKSTPKARKASPARKASASEQARRQAAAAPAAPAPTGERHQNEGHGRRLTMAFEALEAFPALAESRDRLLTVVTKDHVATADVVTAVESDVALITAVLRLANQVQGKRGRVDTVVAAVELLTPQTVQALGARVRTFDFFERSSVWEAAPERFRLHALAHPARGRPHRRRGRLREPRPSDRHQPAARHRQARAAARLSRLPLAGPPRRAHARGPHPPGAPRAGRRPRARRRRARAVAGGCPRRSPRRSSATTTPTSTARPPAFAWPTCSPTTSRARRSRPRRCCAPRAPSDSVRTSCGA